MIERSWNTFARKIFPIASSFLFLSWCFPFLHFLVYLKTFPPNKTVRFASRKKKKKKKNKEMMLARSGGDRLKWFSSLAGASLPDIVQRGAPFLCSYLVPLIAYPRGDIIRPHLLSCHQTPRR